MSLPEDVSTAPMQTPGDPEPVHRADQAVIDVAVASAGGSDVTEPGATAFVVPAGGGVAVVDRSSDAHRKRAGENPANTRAGTTVVRDEASLVTLAQRWGHPETTVVYADPVTRTVVAVLDDDDDASGDYGWRDRRLALSLVHTVEWQRWAALDRKMIAQQAFAEHIEESLEDIREPSGADMLELAQSLVANVGVKFESGVRLRDGQRQFTYREEQDAQAGRNGTLEVPDEFVLALVPWQGRADRPFEVRARLRYRITPHGLTLGYVLMDVDRILRAAFDTDVVGPIRDAGLTVVHGTP